MPRGTDAQYIVYTSYPFFCWFVGWFPWSVLGVFYGFSRIFLESLLKEIRPSRQIQAAWTVGPLAPPAFGPSLLPPKDPKGNGNDGDIFGKNHQRIPKMVVYFPGFAFTSGEFLVILDFSKGPSRGFVV